MNKMNPKEQESQLAISLRLRIILGVVIWLCLAGIVAYRLLLLRTVPVSLPTLITNVPSLKEDNLSVLRTSIKAPPSGTVLLPIIRAEPFD